GASDGRGDRYSGAGIPADGLAARHHAGQRLCAPVARRGAALHPGRDPVAGRRQAVVLTMAERAARAWQRMLSGRRLDLLEPSPLDVEIVDIAHGLARVARWNGQTKGD